MVARKHPKTDAHNHLAVLAAKVAAGEFPDFYTAVEVLHNDWCDVFGDGFCNCEPEVQRAKEGS